MTITPERASDWLIMCAVDADKGRNPDPTDMRRLIADLITKQAAEIERLRVEYLAFINRVDRASRNFERGDDLNFDAFGVDVAVKSLRGETQ